MQFMYLLFVIYYLSFVIKWNGMKSTWSIISRKERSVGVNVRRIIIDDEKKEKKSHATIPKTIVCACSLLFYKYPLHHFLAQGKRWCVRVCVCACYLTNKFPALISILAPEGGVTANSFGLCGQLGYMGVNMSRIR